MLKWSIELPSGSRYTGKTMESFISRWLWLGINRPEAVGKGLDRSVKKIHSRKRGDKRRDLPRAN
jgi:hypothetical protein